MNDFLDGRGVNPGVVPDWHVWRNIAENARRFRDRCRQLQTVEAHGEAMAICGSGPSLVDALPAIEAHKAKGDMIVAVNGAHDFLLRWSVEGAINVAPDAMVLLDPQPGLAGMLTMRRHSIAYFVASQCDPLAFESLRSYHVIVWHALGSNAMPAIEVEVARQTWGAKLAIAGGTTASLRAINLGMALGYKSFDLYGVDSCWLNDRHHATDQGMPDRPVLMVMLDGQSFAATAQMLHQVRGALRMLVAYADKDFTLRCHGPGLLARVLAGLPVRPSAEDIAYRETQIVVSDGTAIAA